MSEYKVVLSGTLRQDFQKDLELFKYLLLFLNNSSPIRNVELMWADDIDFLQPVLNERVNTSSALVQLQPAKANTSKRNSPSTHFCDLVHGFGAHEEMTCGKSDSSAKNRCRSAECTQVYPCHIGLTDIAVPVICDGQYLGTLFSGQVLRSPPTNDGFESVRSSLAGQSHINFEQLERAYFRVPVVTEAQISETVRVLELFARYIANSWKRLQIMSNEQQLLMRELALNRKELAAIFLSGSIASTPELKSLASAVGLRRFPDRVIVLRTESFAGAESEQTQALRHIALNRISNLVEDLCRDWPNTLTISSGYGEICIFTCQRGRNPGHQRLSLQENAESLLTGLRMQGYTSVRMGIGGETRNTEELLRGYQEACAALDTQKDIICFSEGDSRRRWSSELSLAPIVQAIRRGEKLDGPVRIFLATAITDGSGTQQLQQSRAILTWAVEHLALEAISTGVDERLVNEGKGTAVAAMINGSSPYNLCESVRRFAEFLGQQVKATFSQRENKIVLSVANLVEKHGAASVTIQLLAEWLHLSPGHLSRVYSRTTGITLEEYLIRQRIELAKRMLLDPRLNVAEVSERCGFCNPAYFASVFKKYVQCTPREFASRPTVWKVMDSLEPAGKMAMS